MKNAREHTAAPHHNNQREDSPFHSAEWQPGHIGTWTHGMGSNGLQQAMHTRSEDHTDMG